MGGEELIILLLFGLKQTAKTELHIKIDGMKKKMKKEILGMDE